MSGKNATKELAMLFSSFFECMYRLLYALPFVALFLIGWMFSTANQDSFKQEVSKGKTKRKMVSDC